MNRTQQPPLQPLKEITVLSPVRTTLPNGVPLAVLDVGEQEVVRVDILFAGGYWRQSQRLQARLTNRMLREGTEKYSAAVIAEKLDYYGSWLDLSVMAQYACVTVYSLNKYVAETLEVVESMIKEPLFPEKELARVLDTDYRQFLVNMSRVDFLSHRQLLVSLYGGGHPCGNVVEEGDFRRMTPDVLRDFHAKCYHARNCSVFLSGRVTEEVVRLVSGLFGGPFGEGACRLPLPVFPVRTVPDKRVFVERPDALQSSVRMGTLSITQGHPDFLKWRVLVTLFGGYFGSRLMSNIREEKGYTYGISAGVLSFPDSGLFVISTDTDNRHVESVIREVCHEMDRLQQELVGEEELAMVCNYIRGEMCRNYESPFSLADAWISVFVSGLDDGFFARSLQAVNEVTPLELQELARRYLCKETLKEVVAGKKLS